MEKIDKDEDFGINGVLIKRRTVKRTFTDTQPRRFISKETIPSDDDVG